MNFSPARSTDDAHGQATYGMANLRMERTGLPCIVFISQKDAARHDVRVKIAPGPRMRPDQIIPTAVCRDSYAPTSLILSRARSARVEGRTTRDAAASGRLRPSTRPCGPAQDEEGRETAAVGMSSYVLRPFALAEGRGLPAADERRLARWVEANLQVLVDYRDGRIEYTEDALDLLRPV